MKAFLHKVKHFFRRNIYPITVTVCTVLILGVITVSAYSAIKSNDNQIVVETHKEIEKEEVSNINENVAPPDNNSEETSQVDSKETIIFELPFENATISKEYTDSSLLYDKTTKIWCTHQGLDFACEEGKQVRAVYTGKIEKIENTMMNGTIIYLKVNDELTVIYKGLSAEILVKEGETVTKGTVLGKVTSFLAEKAEGVHLHLELARLGKLVDPTEYFSFNK